MRRFAFFLIILIAVPILTQAWDPPTVHGSSQSEAWFVEDTPRLEAGCWRPQEQRSSTRAREVFSWSGPAEWLDRLGPIGLGDAPVFSCFYVESLRFGNGSYGAEWCTPQSVARLVWEVRGGTPPFYLSIAGQRVNAEADFIEMPCEYFRQQQPLVQRVAHANITITAALTDARGRTADASTGLGMVSHAPTERISQLRVWPGIREAFVEAGPRWWPFNSSSQYDALGPVSAIAVARYRPFRGHEWSYATIRPSLGLQSGDGRWKLVPHIRGLDPGTRYEVQAAWMWVPCQGLAYCSAGHLSSASGQRGDWWEPWTTSDSLQWSESLQFVTSTDLAVTLQSSHDTILLSWPDSVGRGFSSIVSEDRKDLRVGEVHVWLTSPDWPGAVWVDSDNAYRGWSTSSTNVSHQSSAEIRVLPSETEFTVHVLRRMPYMFYKPPPQVFNTQTFTNSDLGSHSPLAPSEIDIRIVEDELYVRWVDGTPAVRTQVFLKLKDGSPRTAANSSIRRRQEQGAPGEYVDGPHIEVEFTNLSRGRSYLLFVNHLPAPLKDEVRYPFVCMAWEIALAAVTPDSYFDRYLYSSTEEPAFSIAPADSFEVPFNERFGYQLESPCTLFDPGGE